MNEHLLNMIVIFRRKVLFSIKIDTITTSEQCCHSSNITAWIYYTLDNERFASFHVCLRPTVVLVTCSCFEVTSTGLFVQYTSLPVDYVLHSV